MRSPTQRADPAMPPSLDEVMDDHLIQQVLCDDLEAVADRLPALPSLPVIRALCERIQRVTTTHFARAEMVFAVLPRACRPGEAALAALRRMHQMDEVHGEDLITMLWDHACRNESRNVEQLGYMLRCFFDGCRRAIALKESWIARADMPPIRVD